MPTMIVLQSGFIVSDRPDLAYPETIQDADVLQAIKLGKMIPKDKPRFAYDPRIVELIEEFSGNPKLLLDFDWRERLLRVAKTSFGNLSFYDWHRQQTGNPYLSSLHKTFLLESLEFMMTGVRKTNISSWNHLLEAREISPQDKAVIFNYDDYFPVVAPNVITVGGNYSMVSDMIRQWTSQTDGFQDLLGYLDVIFGKKA